MTETTNKLSLEYQMSLAGAEADFCGQFLLKDRVAPTHLYFIGRQPLQCLTALAKQLFQSNGPVENQTKVVAESRQMSNLAFKKLG